MVFKALEMIVKMVVLIALTRLCTQSDRLEKHYLVLFSLELVISKGFKQLLRSYQRLNKDTKVSIFLVVIVLFRFIART